MRYCLKSNLSVASVVSAKSFETGSRVRVFYEGVIKKNSMVVEVMEKTGKPPLVRAQVLEDTGTGHAPSCKYTKEGWQELKQ